MRRVPDAILRLARELSRAEARDARDPAKRRVRMPLIQSFLDVMRPQGLVFDENRPEHQDDDHERRCHQPEEPGQKRPGAAMFVAHAVILAIANGFLHKPILAVGFCAEGSFCAKPPSAHQIPANDRVTVIGRESGGVFLAYQPRPTDVRWRRTSSRRQTVTVPSRFPQARRVPSELKTARPGPTC
jgi:hypothetical protein